MLVASCDIYEQGNSVFDFGITPELAALYKAQDEAKEVVPCTNYPDMFFPEVAAGLIELRAARETCAKCPIVAQCAEYGIMNEPYHGFWGGLTVKERQQIRNARGYKDVA